MKFCNVCRVAMQQDDQGNYECYRCGRKYDTDGKVLNETEASQANQKLEQDHQVIEQLRQEYGERQPMRCPACGSDQVRADAGFLKKLLGGEGFLCEKCGKKWK